jgi:hypothetical protein
MFTPLARCARINYELVLELENENVKMAVT